MAKMIPAEISRLLSALLGWFLFRIGIHGCHFLFATRFDVAQDIVQNFWCGVPGGAYSGEAQWYGLDMLGYSPSNKGGCDRGGKDSSDYPSSRDWFGGQEKSGYHSRRS